MLLTQYFSGGVGKRLRIEPMLASTEEASNGMNTVR